MQQPEKHTKIFLKKSWLCFLNRSECQCTYNTGQEKLIEPDVEKGYQGTI